MSRKVIAFTGPRIYKVEGDEARNFELMIQIADKAIKTYSPDTVISGAEPTGFDMAVIHAALFRNKGVKIIAAIPFESHPSNYNSLLDSPLVTKVVVSAGSYKPWMYHTRNRYMVNNATSIVALYSGLQGGTEYTWKYALSQKVDRVNMWDEFQKLKNTH